MNLTLVLRVQCGSTMDCERINTHLMCVNVSNKAAHHMAVLPAFVHLGLPSDTPLVQRDVLIVKLISNGPKDTAWIPQLLRPPCQCEGVEWLTKHKTKCLSQQVAKEIRTSKSVFNPFGQTGYYFLPPISVATTFVKGK